MLGTKIIAALIHCGVTDCMYSQSSAAIVHGAHCPWPVEAECCEAITQILCKLILLTDLRDAVYLQGCTVFTYVVMETQKRPVIINKEFYSDGCYNVSHIHDT